MKQTLTEWHFGCYMFGCLCEVRYSDFILRCDTEIIVVSFKQLGNLCQKRNMFMIIKKFVFFFEKIIQCRNQVSIGTSIDNFFYSLSSFQNALENATTVHPG